MRSYHDKLGASVVLLAELAPWSEVVATRPWPPPPAGGTSTTARQLDEADDAAFGPSRPFAPSQAINDKVSLWRGDITRLAVDAIVNAARPSLLGGGGIDKAIHRVAGPGLLEECRPLGGCLHGQCKVTGAHGLPCRLVLHTVGPNRDLHSEAEGYPLLHAAYRSCLARVVEHDVRSVALSCVSTGAYRFPSRPAAHVALSTVRKWLEHGDNMEKVERIIFATFLEQDEAIYTELMYKFYFPPPTSS